MTDNLLRGEERWHITRLQVFNWGTFSNIHDIPISDKGFLFVGASGSGKSTLLDAMITLLFPNPSYNAAAREGDRRKGDRSLLSYVRGAWATQADLEGNGSPKAKTQYLRPGATFSAIALTFNNNAGAATTLMLVASIRKSSNEEESVNRQYFVIDGNYSFNTEDFTGFARNGFDWRWLKGRLPSFTSFNRFNAYCEAFCDRFGIQSTAPLKLLDKAQSAKNLGDLNVFMRTFMLDEPRTLGMAEKLTIEFKDLKEAHAAVVDTRNQLEVLSLAKSQWDNYEEATRTLAQLEAQKATVPWWANITETRLQESERISQQRKLESTRTAVGIAAQEVLDAQSQVDDLRLRRKESGGLAIERLQDTIDRLQNSLSKIEKHAVIAQKQAQLTDHDLPNTAQSWLEFREGLTRLIDDKERNDQELRASRDGLITDKAENEKLFRDRCVEIESMRKHPNNIPAKNLAIRAELAQALDVNESDLPFVGELVEVKKEDKDWQGAIERVLHNFALSILVDDKLYPDFTKTLESRNLKARIVYYRVRGARRDFAGVFRPRSIPSKLNIADCRWDDWLAGELDARFSYLCADTLEEFRKAEQAVTRAGQIKHNAERHEKDDRRDILDRRSWVTGFSNADKLRVFEEEAADLADRISQTTDKICLLEQSMNNIREVIAAANQLINTDWEDIDVASCKAKLDQAQADLAALLKKSDILNQIDAQLKAAEENLKNRRDKHAKLSAKEQFISDELVRIDKRLDELTQELEVLKQSFTPAQAVIDVIESRATSKGTIPITLKNLLTRRDAAKDAISRAQNTQTEKAATAKGKVLEQFTAYLTKWPTAAGDLDATLDSAPDFFVKLDKIEKDGLPRHEKRFRELLETQSLEHFADLNHEMRQARQEILQRMTEVNLSLEKAAFSRLAQGDSHLRIEVKDLKLAEVDDFRAKLSQLIQGAWDEQSIEAAERRFQMIESLATDLDPNNREKERWRKLVLDVRSHVSFTANELDSEGTVLEAYFSGSGKSGGQRQKLTTTCLAAALCYQLSSGDSGKPIFAPVILDEAFDKADSEFTDISMNIFRNFDFQMIVATPEKSVVTLEPYIGGAFYVVMEDRKNSAGLNVRYNDETGKLDLKDLYRDQGPETGIPGQTKPVEKRSAKTAVPENEEDIPQTASLFG